MATNSCNVIDAGHMTGAGYVTDTYSATSAGNVTNMYNATSVGNATSTYNVTSAGNVTNTYGATNMRPVADAHYVTNTGGVTNTGLSRDSRLALAGNKPPEAYTPPAAKRKVEPAPAKQPKKPVVKYVDVKTASAIVVKYLTLHFKGGQIASKVSH